LGQVDLHIHSTTSDGKLTPAEVVRKAAELGYFIDYNDPEFLAKLEDFKNSRLRRAEQMVAKLEGLGLHVEWQRVLELAGTSTIGRPHIAQAMMEKGHVPSFQEAFDEYLGHGKPAYVEREKMLPAEAVAIIVKARGLAVLAHPLTTEDPEGLIAELKPAGLVGLEAYYNGYSAEEVEGLVALAQKHGLITTGGSDFHGIEPEEETAIGGADVPLEAAEQLIALAKEREANLIL